MQKELLSFNLNGETIEVYADPAGSLLHLLRNELGLTGTKEGCGEGECGACTVLLDGKAINSCLVPAGKVKNRSVLTIEGLARGGKYHPLQEAFVEKGAVQCGFCSPGMIMSAYSLLQEKPEPTSLEIKTAISGNLCRCSGYKQIEEAVLAAAEKLKNRGDSS
jgi:aerobic carbon-monoxide dehydrogenase small subunit